MNGFGTLLKEYLEHFKISQTDFADRLGITPKHINEILNKNADISVDLMLAISLITDIDPNLIFRIENEKKIGNYLLKKYKNKKSIYEYLKTFYIKDMVNLGWFKLKHESSFSQTAVDLLDYLNIRNFDMFDNYLNKRILFKKSDKANLVKTYLWIKRCDNLIEYNEIPEYKSSNLVCLLQDLKIERNKTFNEKRLIKIFNKYGIYLVIEEALKGTKVRGCLMVKDKTPTIYMTKFLKEKASFYFALYHEIAHLKTDFNKAKNKIIIDEEISSTNIEEKADIFSLNQMIEESTWNQILNNLDNAENICKQNKIPLCFLYSRLAKEKIISYKSKKYNSNREPIY